MAEKVRELTAEEEARLKVWKDRCVAIALDTSPLKEEDKPELEKAWTLIYEKIGYKKPQFIYCASPKDAQKKINEQMKKEDMQHVDSNHSTFAYGQHEAVQLGYYLFYRDEGLLEHNENFVILDAWFEIAKRCGWCYTFDTHVFVCDRPESFLIDEEFRLNNRQGPAVKYRDGFKMYAIENKYIPEKFIENPESITIEDIQNEKDMETQRIMIELIGMDKYLDMAVDPDGLIDTDCRDADGSAPRVLVRDKLGNKWMICTDGSTKRVYTIAVPRDVDVRTCKQAHELVCGFPENRITMES